MGPEGLKEQRSIKKIILTQILKIAWIKIKLVLRLSIALIVFM